MGVMYQWDESINFNRYTNLDNAETRILEGLIMSKTAHAMRLWNILGDNTLNCLNQPNMQLVQNPKDEKGWQAEFTRRRNMVYKGVGESSGKKVFLSPFLDDAWTEESCRLDIFIDDIIPKNHLTSTVLIGVELIVHNKLINIFSDADEENESTNPSEMIMLYRGSDGHVYTPEEMADIKKKEEEDNIPSEQRIEFKEDPTAWVTIKSRTATLLKSALAELNGVFVAGVGQLQLNTQLHIKSGVRRAIWNNRAYIGHRIVFATLMSGVSENPAYGY